MLGVRGYLVNLEINSTEHLTSGNTRHFGTKKIEKRRKEKERQQEARRRVKYFKLQWRFKKKGHGPTD